MNEPIFTDARDRITPVKETPISVVDIFKRFLGSPSLVVALLITGVYVATAISPSLIEVLMYKPDVFDWGFVTFNFVHASFLHYILNLSSISVFHKEIKKQLKNHNLLHWLLYFGLVIPIGLCTALFVEYPTVGYSGVLLALIGFGTANQYSGYKLILLYLAGFHGMLLFMDGHQIAVHVHLIGFIIGLVYGLVVRYILNVSPSSRS